MLVNKSSTNKFTLESLMLVYLEAYPQQGFRSINYQYEDFNQLTQPLILLTSFLGLPNKMRISTKLSALDVLKNMLDWDLEDEKKGIISTLDKVLAVPMFLYHVLKMLLKIPFSLAQLVTEFLPGLSEEFCRITMETVKKPSLTFYAAKIGYGISSTLHFIGRAITAPLKSMHESIVKGPGWGMLSMFVSGMIWAIPATYLISIALPALIIGAIIFKLATINFALGTCLALIISLAGIVSLRINDELVKPLLKKIGRTFNPHTEEIVSETNSNISTKKILETIPPEKKQIAADITNNPSIIKNIAMDLASTKISKPVFAKENGRWNEASNGKNTHYTGFVVKFDGLEKLQTLIIQSDKDRSMAYSYSINGGSDIACNKFSWTNALFQAATKQEFYSSIAPKEFELRTEGNEYYYDVTEESRAEISKANEESIGILRHRFPGAPMLLRTAKPGPKFLDNESELKCAL